MKDPWARGGAWVKDERYKPVRQTAGAAALVVALVLSSGLLISLVNRLDRGAERDLLINGAGILVAVIFIWLMVARVRNVLQGKAQLRTNVVLAGLDILILVGVFAWVHSVEGLIDSSVPGNPVIYDYWASLEFVVLNFTTLGAPNLYPYGHGRLLIALEGLIGYIVLGLFTTAAVTLLSLKQRE